MRKKSLHEKAIILLQGGCVEADGLVVCCKQYSGDWNECDVCDMDSLCHQGSEICDLCMECSSIVLRKCYLRLVN